MKEGNKTGDKNEKNILIALFMLMCMYLLAQEPTDNHAQEQISNQAENSTVYYQNYHTGDHELFIMPTAQTMPKGSAYFSDYELFFINWTYAPTNSTHVGVFSLFPLVNSFTSTLTLGVKQNYYRGKVFAGAVWSNYLIDGKVLIMGNVFSFYQNDKSLHIALIKGWDFSNENSEITMVMGGIRIKNFIAEYTLETGKYSDYSFMKLITLGFRFGKNKVSFDIAGIRPLQIDYDSPLIAIPYVKVTYKFN